MARVEAAMQDLNTKFLLNTLDICCRANKTYTSRMLYSCFLLQTFYG